VAGSLRVHLFRPADDPFAPWTGVFTLWLSLGIWYSCTNQFYIQRCLGARSEWDARMGVITAMGLKLFMPFLVVFPGMAALILFGEGLPRDRVYLKLVQEVLPVGFLGIVLAAMAAAIMSTVSSVLNSASTVLTIDFYQRYFRPSATQDELVRFGRLTTTIILVFAIVWSPFLVKFQGGLFIYIQDMAAYFGPPISAVFLHALFNRRATALAANITLVGGILLGIALKLYGDSGTLPLAPLVAPFLNRALLTWLICMPLIGLVSLFDRTPKTSSPPRWKWSDLRLPEAERALMPGWQQPLVWWACVAACVAALFYIFK